MNTMSSCWRRRKAHKTAGSFWMALLLVLLAMGEIRDPRLLGTATAWVLVPSTTAAVTHQRSCAGRFASLTYLEAAADSASSNEDRDHDDDKGPTPPPSLEQSRMLQYVSGYLERTAAASEDQLGSTVVDGDDGAYYTHLLAIPIDACHELMLELESVQRGILYHCPVLVHSCIAGARARLPLLYVQAVSGENGNGAAAAATSPAQATVRLQKLLQAAIEKHVVKRSTADDDSSNAESLNAEGVPPLTVQFQSLEIDGGEISNNQVLSTVSDPDCEGTQTLQRLVEELQATIAQETGWRTSLPEDNHSNSSENNDSTSGHTQFRPRIAFMRLPDDWEEHLKEQVAQDGVLAADETYLLTADQGGNGISPIHWGRWADDVLGGLCRLREVAVYQRSTPPHAGSGLSSPEQTFDLPAASVPLPDGNAAQQKGEAVFAKYQEQRLREMEAALKREREDNNSEGGVSSESASRPAQVAHPPLIPEDDLLLSMTKAKLEKIYEGNDGRGISDDIATNSASSEASEQDPKNEKQPTEFDWSDIQAELSESPQRPSDPESIDDWTRQRIEKAVMSRARVQSELELAKKKDKPPIEENTVFTKYKNGSLVPENNDTLLAPRDLPPFPSKEHCTGFWRMLGSPTGFDVEEGDASRSDNLVLRVDGTIAGGPILDQETRQKASGGTWTLSCKEGRVDPVLQIRLVIPPQKKRVLVMEGMLESLSTMPLDVPLAPNTFRIPQLEDRAASSAAAAKSDELFCNGSVWIEDAETKGESRDDIGTFSIMKLNTPTDPSQFTITIPRNVRNQD